MKKKVKEDQLLRLKILEEEDKAAADAAAVTSFTEYDHESAIRKIASVACDYDRTRQPGGLTAFDCVMDPVELKDQLKRNFGIKVNAAELGALCNHFDKDGDGTIDGSEFLIEFFRIGIHILLTVLIHPYSFFVSKQPQCSYFDFSLSKVVVNNHVVICYGNMNTKNVCTRLQLWVALIYRTQQL
jgi:hypothetical protein